ncbi:MAG: alpha/beta hydrolase [Parcubacteria group bacterium]|jgi:predicted alpha/beta hydrolase family esterase
MEHVQKNCIIVHGCEYDAEHAVLLEQRTAENHWTTWVRDELVKRGVSAQTPTMPTSWAQEYEGFKKEFEKYHVNENTVLVGHSCSCSFLVRWLGETKQKIAKLVLVAPWKVFDPYDTVRAAFYTYDIDETIVNRVGDIVMFTADNESDDGKKSLEIFHHALGGRIIALSGRGHYRTREWEKSAFPELLEEILA